MDNPSQSGQIEETLPAGTVLFGQLEIVEVLGGGGMGKVYRARHRSLGGFRAVKVVRPDQASFEKVRDALKSEAKALMELNHDAVVRCNDLLGDNERLCLVMELVEGPSLQRILLGGTALPDEEVLALRKRMLEGLAAMHAKGLAHRDISPGNIILPNGQPELAKLIDFGLAVSESADSKRAFMGNPVYASPEQYALFGGKVDTPTDIYSLGLSLAHAAMGEPLPSGNNFNEAKALRKVRPQLPDYFTKEMRAAIAPMVEPDPRKRPSASQLLKGGVAVPDEGGEEEYEEVEVEPSWLQAVIYTATAVGIGLAIGIAIWLMKFTDVMASGGPAPATVAAIAGPTAPVIVGTPGPFPAPPPDPPKLPVVAPPPAPVKAAGYTREQIMATAKEIADHTWTCGERNLTAPCARNVAYKSDFAANETVRGLPYDWGGIDGPQDFDAKIASGRGDGAHRRHGILKCTAGTDCSGFVTYCWGHRGTHAFATKNMDGIATRLAVNVYTDLKPGDALNRPGSHVVLFAGYQPNGWPILYEANGAAGRVIRNERMSWSKLSHYVPVRFKFVQE